MISSVKGKKEDVKGFKKIGKAHEEYEVCTEGNGSNIYNMVEDKEVSDIRGKEASVRRPSEPLYTEVSS